MQQTSQQLLTDREDYLSAGVHIGTQRNTADMDDYIFQVKKNGLAIINLEDTDRRIREVANTLQEFAPGEILVCGEREQLRGPVETLSEKLGTNAVDGRFMPGSLTNPNSDQFIEPRAIVVVDPDENRQPITEANKVGIPVIGIVDSGAELGGIDEPIPANNKARKAVGTVLYLLGRAYADARGTEFDAGLNDFRPNPDRTEQDGEDE